MTVEAREVIAHEWVPAQLQDGIPHPLDGDDAIAGWETSVPAPSWKPRAV